MVSHDSNAGSNMPLVRRRLYSKAQMRFDPDSVCSVLLSGLLALDSLHIRTRQPRAFLQLAPPSWYARNTFRALVSAHVTFEARICKANSDNCTFAAHTSHMMRKSVLQIRLCLSGIFILVAGEASSERIPPSFAPSRYASRGIIPYLKMR